MVGTLTPSLLTDTLGLAQKGEGLTRPNPLVGAVVLDTQGRQFQGYHPRYGSVHAEVMALEAAGPAARGSTLYCSLEPCCHSGPGKHQPPCTRKIIEAGVRKVVVGQLDPNPFVRGKGLEELRRAGIEVELTPDPRPFLRLNPGFNTRHILGRPYVHLKLALSLDGRISTSRDLGRYITGPQALSEVQTLRSQVDALGVGVGTVIIDDPQLTVRTLGYSGTQPRAVIFDRNLKTPINSFLIQNRAEEVLLVASKVNKNNPTYRALEAHGVRVLETEPTLISQLRALAQASIQTLLVEPGVGLAAAIFSEGVWDEITFYYAPKLLGSGLGLVDGAPVPEFEDGQWRVLGDHGVFHGYRKGWLEDLSRGLSNVHRVS